MAVIEYALQEKDYLTHQLFVASRSKRTRRRKMTMWLAEPVLLVFIGLLLSYLYGRGSLLYTWIMLGAGGFWLVWYPFHFRRMYRKHFLRHIRENFAGRCGRQSRVECRDGSFFTSEATGEARISLEDLGHIFHIPGYYLFALKTGQMMIVPHDERVPQQALSAFVDEVCSASGIGVTEIPGGKW